MIINGKNYRIPEINFDEVVRLEETGISLFDITNPKALRKRFLTIIRAFVCLATGLEEDGASYLIQQHILGGGSMEGWLEEITEAVEKSGFFQAMMKKSQKAKLHPVEKEQAEISE